MELAILAFKQIVIMVMLMGVGILCYKLHLLTLESNKSLSNLCLYLVNPVIIFISYQRSFDSFLLKGLLVSLLLAFISFLIAIFSSRLLLPKHRGANVWLERYSLIYPNCGFIGIPLVSGIFGYEGVFYLTAYITMFNLFVWTHGIMLMSGRRSLQSIKSVLFSPSIFAIFLGFLCFVFNIQAPSIILAPLTMIGAMNTPLAMIVAGVSLSQTDFVTLIKTLRIYLLCFYKLLFIPLLVLLFFWFLPFSQILIGTSLLCVACPTGAMVIMLSYRYDRDDRYASEIFAATTFGSIITIPLIMFLLSFR